MENNGLINCCQRLSFNLFSFDCEKSEINNAYILRSYLFVHFNVCQNNYSIVPENKLNIPQSIGNHNNKEL